MTISLITGATGFVGEHLIELLEGDVYGFDLAVDPHQDVRNYEAVRTAIDSIRPDHIYHLAGQAYVPEGTTDPHRAFDVNTIGTLNLLEAVRHTGSRAKILIAGTSAEYGSTIDTAERVDEQTLPQPNTPYGVSKLAATTLGQVYAEMYGMQVICTRAFNHTGPGQPAQYAIPGFARQVVQCERGKLERISHGNLEAVRNYSDVRDVVRAYRALMNDAPSGYYVLGSDRSSRIGQVLQRLIELSELDPAQVYTVVDRALYRPGMQQGGTDANHPAVDTSKVHQYTGWAPSFGLELTLADMLTYWRSV